VDFRRWVRKPATKSCIDTDSGLSPIESERGISFVFGVIGLANLLQLPHQDVLNKAQRRHRFSKKRDKAIASIWFNLIESRFRGRPFSLLGSSPKK
jgi:hypothetical protein